MKKLLVTGSAGLVGSEVVTWFSQYDWEIVGVDNNMRADFFGPKGDTTWNTNRMEREIPSYRCVNLDIRDRSSHSLLHREQEQQVMTPPLELCLYSLGNKACQKLCKDVQVS
jgi:CDP-paratose 2-epimerase